MNIKEFIIFLKLAIPRLKSYDNYVKFQKFQSDIVIKEIEKHGINLKKSRVLEIGCGHGGYSLGLYRHSKELIISDLEEPKDFLKKNKQLKFKGFDASKQFPFKDEEFDVVFCSNIIEHIPKPSNMLKEIRRVLKKDGVLFLSFPPFYTPIGGHQFKPYHYLGNNAATSIYNVLHKKKIKSMAKCEGSWGLYPLSIRKVKTLIKKAGFKIKDQWTRYLGLDVSRIPLLNELITWHVSFKLVKK